MRRSDLAEKYRGIIECLFIMGLILGLAPKFGIKHWGMDERIYLYSSIMLLGARVFMVGTKKEWAVAALGLATYVFGNSEIFYGVLIVLASKGIESKRLAKIMAVGIFSMAGIFILVNFYLELYDFGSRRVNYLVYNPNTLMIYFMGGVIAYIHSRGYKTSYTENGILLAVSTFFLYTTGSRTGFMVILIALTLVEVMRSGLDRKLLLNILAGLIGAAVVTSFLGPIIFHNTFIDEVLTSHRFGTWYHYMNFDFIGLLPNMKISSDYLARHALDNAHLYLLMKWGGIIYILFLAFFAEGSKRLYENNNLEGLATVLLFSLGGLGEKILVWPELSLALYLLYSTFVEEEKNDTETTSRMTSYVLVGTLCLVMVTGSYGVGKTISDYRGLEMMRRVHVGRNVELRMGYDSVLLIAPTDGAVRNLYIGRYPLKAEEYRVDLGGKYQRITTLSIPMNKAKDLRVREGRNYRKVL